MMRTRRFGLVGVKQGMMQLYDPYGVKFPVTVVQVDGNIVTQVKKELDRRGFLGVQVGAGALRLKNTTKPMIGHFVAQGSEPRHKLFEFRVSPDAIVPSGTVLYARHFLPGQFVDITGTSIGKGFQGGMKRWGFKGQPATHGVSLTHRSLGATGSRQDPGKVFKGKKMAGRMGGKQITVQNIQIHKIDCHRNLLFLKGAVPGFSGNYVIVRDAIKKPIPADAPMPTYLPQPGVEEPLELLEPLSPKNPLEYLHMEIGDDDEVKK